MEDKDLHFMHIALEEARAAAGRDEVPIGAVLTGPDGAVIARNGNRTRELNDPSAHAEMLCIREGCLKGGAQRIPDCDLYITLEPCAMCAAAISFARVRRLIIGAPDPKGGGILHGGKFYEQPTCHHRPDVTCLEMPECGQVLKNFFAAKRKKN